MLLLIKHLGKSLKISENTRMTEEKTILARINQLPENLKQEVLDFAEFLQKKHGQGRKANRRKAGNAKGKYKLSPDFDAPLEDFKEYM